MATTLVEPGVQEVGKSKTSTKYVYSFGGGKADGNGKMKDVLGGKGAGLAEMTNAGLPVPPGFTIQTEACREYMRQGGVSEEVDRQMDAALARLESLQGQKLGKGDNPQGFLPLHPSFLPCAAFFRAVSVSPLFRVVEFAYAPPAQDRR